MISYKSQKHSCYCTSHNISVNTVTNYGLQNLRFGPWKGQDSCVKNIHNSSGAHPASHSTNIRVPSLGIKQPRCEANTHLHLTEVMNEWSHISAPLILLHGMHKGNCTINYCHYKHSIFNLNIRQEQFSKLHLKNRTAL